MYIDRLGQSCVNFLYVKIAPIAYAYFQFIHSFMNIKYTKLCQFPIL